MTTACQLRREAVDWRRYHATFVSFALRHFGRFIPMLKILKRYVNNAPLAGWANKNCTIALSALADWFEHTALL